VESCPAASGTDPVSVRKLVAFRKKRNIGGYERAGSTSATEAAELRDLARLLRDNVRGWLERYHPELL
jgi:hypothetical protein